MFVDLDQLHSILLVNSDSTMYGIIHDEICV